MVTQIFCAVRKPLAAFFVYLMLSGVLSLGVYVIMIHVLHFLLYAWNSGVYITHTILVHNNITLGGVSFWQWK